MRLAGLIEEARLIYAERRDTLRQQRLNLASDPRRARFTADEIAKRAKRLETIEALGRALAVLEARREELPDWVLSAFEGGDEPQNGRRTPEQGAENAGS